jgi:protein-S-isoprenylcysteine O-methyltransferase Ste14
MMNPLIPGITVESASAERGTASTTRRPYVDRILESPLFHLGSGAALAGVWIVFAYAHVLRFIATDRWTLLIFCAAETLTAAFLFVRTAPRSFSRRPLEWMVAALGTFAPMLFRPSELALLAGAEIAVTVGAVLQVAAVISLNRSFAMLPALREIKTGGFYRVVRHPVYSSYLVTVSGYLASNFSLRNLATYSAAIAFMLWRVRLEEAHLATDAAYRDYCARVPWRLIPRLY